MLDAVTPPLFVDRRDAGRQLGSQLASQLVGQVGGQVGGQLGGQLAGHQAGRPPGPADDPSILVLALPRGGVPVAAEVAQALDAPLDLWLVRKLGLPGQPEYAMGAIATGDVRVLNDDVIARLAIGDAALESVTRAELRELHRRERLYRGTRPWPTLRARTVVLVDDGLATGATMRAAVQSLRAKAPARIVVAVPVAAPDTCELLRRCADEVVCLHTPARFRSVGQWYEDFAQTSDAEVRDCLELQAAHG